MFLCFHLFCRSFTTITNIDTQHTLCFNSAIFIFFCSALCADLFMCRENFPTFPDEFSQKNICLGIIIITIIILSSKIAKKNSMKHNKKKKTMKM